MRAKSNGLTGAYSESIHASTFPVEPIANTPATINATYFTANWQAAEGAKSYRLDVSRDNAFEQIVEGFSDVNVGNVLTYEVSQLLPDSDYFYRVRSEAAARISESSNIISITTLSINPYNSEISTLQLRAFANGDQAIEISVIVRSNENQLLDKLDVQLLPENGNSKIEIIQGITDESGQAYFSVTNTIAEKVTYSITAAETHIGDINVEFLGNKGIVKLGNNYPNPFQHLTTIPVTIPSQMDIRLTIYNSLGISVQTIVDEQMETVYYEIPFQTAGLASGVYFYRLVVNDEILTKKMVFVD